MKRAIFSLLFAAGTLHASAIVTFTRGWSLFDQEGMGLGPCIVTVNGERHIAYDFTMDYNWGAIGGQWAADLVEPPTLPTTLYPGGRGGSLLQYSALTWIGQDFLTAQSREQMTADQYAMYSIFSTAAPTTPESQAELDSALARAAALGFAPGWTFVQWTPVPYYSSQRQDFLYHADNTVPEPRQGVLILLACVVLLRKRLTDVLRS